MAYATLAQLKTYAGISDADDDAILTSKLDRATAIVDMRCNRALVAETATAKYFTPGEDTDGAKLYFHDFAAAITEVLNGDSGTTEVTSSEYATIGYDYDGPYYGIRILDSANKSWEYDTDREYALKVTANWGWFSSIPDDVRHFTIRLAAFLYRQKATSLDIERPLLTDAGVTLLPPRLANDLTLLTEAYGRKS
jgi:hypothetical protein